MKVDGIPGESTTAGHVGEIDLLGYNWGITVPVPPQGGSSTPLKQDVNVTMTTSSASPKVFLASANGQHISRVELSVRQPGSTFDNVKLNMSDVVITSYTNGGTQSMPLTTDQMTLYYSTMQIQYTPTVGKGSGTPVTTGWDFVRNLPI